MFEQVRSRDYVASWLFLFAVPLDEQELPVYFGRWAPSVLPRAERARKYAGPIGTGLEHCAGGQLHSFGLWAKCVSEPSSQQAGGKTDAAQD